MLGHLPPRWHTTPVGELAARRPDRRSLGRMETNVVVRAVAVVLVVAAHAGLFPVAGGAHALLAVAGCNFVRFQLVSGRMLRSVARIAVPSMAWIGLMAATRHDFGVAHALLVNGLVGDAGARWSYWFVEALVQLLVPLAVLFSLPRVRALERARPLLVAGDVLAVGLAVRFDVVALPPQAYRVMRPQEVFWLFAVHGFFGDPVREVVVLAAVLLLVWVPSVRVPGLLRRPVASVASASLYVYLTHWAVYPVVLEHAPPLAAVVASVAVGVGVAAGVRWATAQAGRARAAAGAVVGRRLPVGWVGEPATG